MNRRHIYSICLILIYLALPFSQVLAQEEKLVPTVYPGSALEPFANVSDGKVYYSKDAFNKVNAFYTAIYSSPVAYEGANYYKVRPMKNRRADDSSRLAFNIKDNSQMIQVIPEAEYDNYWVSQALANLKRAYIDKNTTTALRFDPMKFANDPEIRRAQEKFSYLLKMFYAKTPVPNDNGKDKYKGIEELLYQQYFNNPETDRQNKLKDMQERYLKLVQEGSLEKARVLAKEMNELSTVSSEDPEERWKRIIKYLWELENIYFKTKIIIYD